MTAEQKEGSNNKMEEEENDIDLLSRARQLWLSPNADLKEVERLYHAASGLSPEEEKTVAEKVALLMCQSGRSQMAEEVLSSFGYKCRLSRAVLDYPFDSSSDSRSNGTTTSSCKAPCLLLDNFLTTNELKALKNVFSDEEANYWLSHKYQVEPASPYVSYLIPLSEATNNESFGLIGHIISKIHRNIRKEFPLVSKTKYVEMWAHNRPHASGHQMHFDSDNEGAGGIRNPIVSSILYLSDKDVGGPSLITNQKLIHRHLATKGWLCHPKEKRLVAFDGKVLHGVIPGKGSTPSMVSSDNNNTRRVTIMFAFWKSIKERPGMGAAQAFPDKNSKEEKWATTLRESFVQEKSNASRITTTEPVEIAPVYETLKDEPWLKEMGFPEYDAVFQGF